MKIRERDTGEKIQRDRNVISTEIKWETQSFLRNHPKGCE